MRRSVKTFLKSAAKDKIARSANPAIVRASTIYFKSMQEMRKHQKNIAQGKNVKYWDYGRQGSQTTIQLQNILKEFSLDQKDVALSKLVQNIKDLHINLNDDTVEGMIHKDLPVMGIQFHSEAAPGPWDNEYLFDRFLNMVKEVAK